VVAAIAATAGDLLLLATSNATRPGFEWLPAPSETLLLVGTYLGVVAIPCYGLGYRDVAARFEPPYRPWLVALGVAGAVLGGTTHGLTGLVIHVEQTGGMGGVDPITVVARHGAYLLPLWAVIAVVTILGSVVFATGVLGGRSSFPRWMALANPAVLTLVLVLVGAASETGRAFLVPAAPNVAHVVFFGLGMGVPLDTPRRARQ
jgi:hypothetical protein